MDSIFPKINLGQIADFRNGLNYSKKDIGKGLKVIGVTDFQDRIYPIYDELEEVNPDDISISDEQFLKENDILFVRSNGNRELVGRTLIIKNIKEKISYSGFTIRLRFTEDEVNPYFQLYVFKAPQFRKQLANYGGGTNISNINQSILNDIEIPYPEIEVQNRIASILSAFDDLIENNTRRISILEEMARLIYREWFVHYRYPGHEEDKLVDSGTELGGVPKGWGVAAFDDYLDVLSGGTPKTKIEEFWNGDIPFFTPKDATDLPFVLEADKSITQKGLQKCSSKLYEPYTVFITARGTVGKLNMPIYPMAMNQSCYALRAKKDTGLSQFFIYYSLHEKVETLQKRAHGAVFDTIIKDTFKQLKGVFPNKELVEDFDKMVTPILRKVEVLMVKNIKLKETRDLLLPKLISGKIELKDITLN